MRIAVVAPSPVPFTIGGAETVWWNLVQRINDDTPHVAELIKLPTPERSLPDLIQSYEKFSKLDLYHFDMVITGKYPAWMIEHPNHVVYMLHRLRGLYDTYHLTGQPLAPVAGSVVVDDLIAFMERRRGQRIALPEFFARAKHAMHAAPEACLFPGPLARHIVHWLDEIGLDPSAIRDYAAISRTIAERPGYFPAKVSVAVAYPPSSLVPVPVSGNDYFFTCSRLDGPKRIDLLIEAMRHVPQQIALKIAGTGPEADSLKRLAAGDPRIEFLGYVTDRDLVSHYAGARAVPFVPQDEDYGLIAIEAMRCGKPVITAIDSGGPNELIEDGKTGFSVAANAEAIAGAMRILANDPALAVRMGEAAEQAVSGIDWQAVLSTLIDRPKDRPLRPSLCVATTFPIHPPRGGGQSRVFNLYRKLARVFDITVVAITGVGEEASDRLVAPGLREIRVPKSLAHHQEEAALTREAGGMAITDVVMPELIALTPAYEKIFAVAARNASAVVACHPYLLPAIRRASSAPLWYEAQDAEFTLKKVMLTGTARGEALAEAARSVERAVCDESMLIFTCSQDDSVLLAQEYGFDPSKTVVVPNGVDTDHVPLTNRAGRNAAKATIGTEAAFTVLFMGSWHQPNIDAVDDIIRLAPSCPDMSFVVVGSVGRYFANHVLPENVGLMNEVDEITLQIVLRTADCAINPMRTGTGSNLKMLDYFSSGLPVISTRHGIRGLNAVDGVHVRLAEIDELPDALEQLRDEAPEKTEARILAARRMVEEEFDWRGIADRFLHVLTDRKLIEQAVPRGATEHNIGNDSV